MYYVYKVLIVSLFLRFFSWSCSDSVVFVFLMELFRQCGICCFSHGVVPTVWYLLFFSWSCSDSVVFFVFLMELFRQCSVLFSHGVVPTVWYLLFFSWSCSDSVLFVVFRLISNGNLKWPSPYNLFGSFVVCHKVGYEI
jgi:hypothetical protein